ncbi:hypothetical protein LSH36_32g11006 [Paralvinella palmiformis]|uniref:Sushi domain-containing protein n=1 Tax=Paralvinella palmiformis TaxID=53620 RepID=A0AAD9K992_9ANNE|nr:hypothetical protein LSH36_32g11006 [Paralvinella palmiformis]
MWSLASTRTVVKCARLAIGVLQIRHIRSQSYAILIVREAGHNMAWNSMVYIMSPVEETGDFVFSVYFHHLSSVRLGVQSEQDGGFLSNVDEYECPYREYPALLPSGGAMPNGRQGDGSLEERGRLLSAESDDTPRTGRRPEVARGVVARRRRQTYERVNSEPADDDTPVTAVEVDAEPIDRELNPEITHSATAEGLETSTRTGARSSERAEGDGSKRSPAASRSAPGSQRSSIDRGRHCGARPKVFYYQNRFIRVNIDLQSEPSAREYETKSEPRAPTSAARIAASSGSAVVSGVCQSASPGDEPTTVDKSSTGVSSVSPIRPQTHQSDPEYTSDVTGQHQDQRDSVSGPPTPVDQVTSDVDRSAPGQKDAPETSSSMQPVPGTSSMGDPLAPMGSLSAIPGVMTLGSPAPVQVPVKKVKRKKKDTIFNKIARVLEDNRVKRGDKDMGLKLRTVNRLQDASELQILKKILNIIFLITGAALLLGVIVVIIYTAVSTSCPKLKEPENGYTVPRGCRVSVMSVCQFRCNSGYRLEGSETRICQNDSSWSGTKAICVYTDGVRVAAANLKIATDNRTGKRTNSSRNWIGSRGSSGYLVARTA